MKLKSILFVLLVLATTVFVYAEKAKEIQYAFPVHNSILNSRTTEIIIRPGDVLDRASIDYSNQIIVKDAEGNRYSGTIILSSDQKTIIFKPDSPFASSETVSVTFVDGVESLNGKKAPAFSFQFTVTPLETPINPQKYLNTKNPVWEAMEQNNPVESETATTDSLPSDFPRYTVEVTGTGTPADGAIFISPTFFANGQGYNLIVKNNGDLQYYQKIEDGVPVDFKVLPNGHLSYGSMYEFHQFVGGGPTVFHMMDSTYTIIEDFDMGNGYLADSHEFQLLPNGHSLLLAYDVQYIDMSKLVEGGHPGATVAGTIIQELDVEQNVIFQWRSWDYFDITDSYNKITDAVFDAIHINSLELDTDKNLLVSTMALGEITKIDRQTGDIIWRMGGKNNQFTFINEYEDNAPLYFMYHHDVRRIENGNITLFDCGDTVLRPWSRAVEYKVDEVNKTVEKVWEYRHQPDIYASTMGSVQRLPNGNSLIGWGSGTAGSKVGATEVDANGNVVLEMKFNALLLRSYRAFKYDWDGGRPAADVMRIELLAGNTYSFDEGDQETGVTIKVNSHGGFGYNEAVVQRYTYGPLKPQFLGKSPIILPTRLVLSQFNISNIEAEISFDVDFYGFEDPGSIVVYCREFEGRGLFEALPTTYNHVTNQVRATMTKFGEYIFGYKDHDSQAFPPLLVSPANSADVDISNPVKLEWSPVGYAEFYQLQVAKDTNFSDLVVDEQYLAEAIYTFNAAAEPTTYYWRVQASNDIEDSEWSTAKTFQTRQPYIKVLSPNGSESWQLGLPHFITWESIVDGDVVIQLYDNNTFISLIDTVTNTGGYEWDIPIDISEKSTYKISITSVANSSVSDMSDGTFSIVDDVSVENSEIGISDYQLFANYPNPFNAQTTISYQLPQASDVILKIFDVQGKEVCTLVNERQSAQRYEINFDASELASGIYFYKIQAGKHFMQTRKLLLIK